jgi:hypothetical protein
MSVVHDIGAHSDDAPRGRARTIETVVLAPLVRGGTNAAMPWTTEYVTMVRRGEIKVHKGVVTITYLAEIVEMWTFMHSWRSRSRTSMSSR